MLLGYNTNGFAHHSLRDAIHVLTQLGYRSAAITLEHDLLDPPDLRGVDRTVHSIREALAGTGLRVTVETGARFLLDPFHKHQPTLLSKSADGRRRRLAFLEAAVEIAAGVGADCVSLWSGAGDDSAPETELWGRLTDGLNSLLNRAQRHGIRLGFEPEPGMFIDTMDRFARLTAAVDDPLLGLTLDVGHVHCLQDGDLRAHVNQWHSRLWNVHVEDMRRGIHEHLPFGQGEMNFDEVFSALRGVSYAGPIHVELPRQSHDAVLTARRSHEFLQRFLAH